MDADSRYISTLQAADALGVSVSTVKRWVDEGILPADRTAGGHRKLLRAEILALARQGDLPRQDVSELVLPSDKQGQIEVEDLPPPFLNALLRGEASEVRQLVRRAYASGISIETLADEVISPVMHKVGHQWETEKIDVWHEHRGSRICASALYELQAEVEKRAERNRPLAFGGAPEGDPYELATLLAQLVLLDAGWEAINLGPNTPLENLAQAVHELRPRLVWLSASHLNDPKTFVRKYQTFFRDAERCGIAVAIGGRALTEPIRAQMPYTTHGDRLAHLAAFARTLHPRRRRPPRGRPRKE